MDVLEGYASLALANYGEAVQSFRRRLQRQPNSTYAGLWLFLAELKAGRTQDDELVTVMKKLDVLHWPGPVAHMLVDDVTPDAVQEFAARPDMTMSAKPGSSMASTFCSPGRQDGHEQLSSKRLRNVRGQARPAQWRSPNWRGLSLHHIRNRLYIDMKWITRNTVTGAMFTRGKITRIRKSSPLHCDPAHIRATDSNAGESEPRRHLEHLAKLTSPSIVCRNVDPV